MSKTTEALVRQSYRSLLRLVHRLPEASSPASLSPEESLRSLRSAFRTPLAPGESVGDRLEEAESKRSFLKMVTPRERPSSSRRTEEGASPSRVWVYRNGERLERDGASRVRDKNGRVVSNWDGKNLDPDSVKQHNYQLKRMGFRNNAHAKGIF
ncbi:unnamed protein product [Pseudo-nitzschia multistriata]|uniref:Uncharacterized protein n=1 Tax=Pseudo-nitzschia multistriata TaxID=183589 RepID=A0A448YU73_9STRA|nr:unnamed protein product [Pseudo-nitzschia multistriata]